MKIKAELLPLLFLILISGCASIISGTTQEMSFHSNPEGAAVIVDGKTLGTTPLTYPLKKSKYSYVVFQKDGFKPLTLPMDSQLDGWFWGNIVLGGFLGSTTDSVSGAANQYSPGQFMVSLEPLQASRLESETSKAAQQKAREFIVIAYTNIVAELAKGNGEYVNSLMGVLQVPPEKQPEAINKLRALSEVYTNILEFADHAIELYLKQNPVPVPPGDAPQDPAEWARVQSALAPEQYAFLVKGDLKAAESEIKTLTEKQEDALTHYILHSKGRMYEIDHHFKMTTGLDENERAFIRWYLKSRSGYMPI